MTSIEDFTSQYGLVQKIDAFGYLDYLKNESRCAAQAWQGRPRHRRHPLKASRGEGKTTTTIALIDALRERGIDAAAVLRPAEHGHHRSRFQGWRSGGGKAS